jgi:hypothetical protein
MAQTSTGVTWRRGRQAGRHPGQLAPGSMQRHALLLFAVIGLAPGQQLNRAPAGVLLYTVITNTPLLHANRSS